MRLTTGILAIVALVGAAAPSAPAQSQKPPKRPRLDASSDTNDARAYYDLGVARLKLDPRTAADAFYWACRLRPGWPEALYAQAVAGFMKNEFLLIGYVEGRRSAIASREARHLDSLEYHAERLNPFFLRDLDRVMFASWIMAEAKQDMQRSGEQMDRREAPLLDYVVNSYLLSGSNYTVRA